jgi:predicted nucleic acid-binding protein
LNFLIDTNIISEVRRRDRCDPNVNAWYASADENDLYLSVLVTGEIRRGIELARRRDPVRAAVFEQWLADIEAAFGVRILPIDRAVTDEWGRLSTVRSVPPVDGLLAATAKVHGMTLATRNEADVAGLGVAVLNPFRFAAPQP